MRTTVVIQTELKNLDKDAPDYSQKRMELMVEFLQRYVGTYDQEYGYKNYSDSTLILDILYGLGVVLNPEEHSFAGGFDKWKQTLKQFIEDGN
jgi:hypothetical protein